MKTKTMTKSAFRRSVLDDLAAYRRQIVQAALMQRPDVAYDLLVFHLARDVAQSGSVRSPLEIAAKEPWTRCESSRQDMGKTQAGACIEDSRSRLSLDWIGLDEAKGFECFLSLSRSEKAAILAYIVAQTLRPQLADEADADPTLEKAGTLLAIHCGRYWRPDTAFFERLTKAQALEIGGAVMGPDFAQRHLKTKAKALAPIMGRLFDPESPEHQKLPKAQRGRITAWQPGCMAFAPLEVASPS